MSSQHLRMAARAVRRGGVIAYPTEGVFGLGCNPLDPDAGARLLELKGRDPTKGLILIGADWAQLREFAGKLGDDCLARMLADWPGPVTWVIPAATAVPAWITGGRDTLAVRIPGHSLARDLCRAAGTALTSTSANRSGSPAARSAFKVRQQFGRRLDYLLPGKVGSQRGPSEIRLATDGKILRARVAGK